MTDTLAKIGYSSHIEAICVFLGLGFILGLSAAITEIVGSSPAAILGVAEQGVALNVFFLLCIFGLLGLLFADWKRLPRGLARFLKWACPPILRSGLTTGFIASGITLGLGAGAFLPFWLFGSSVQEASAARLFLLGVVLLLLAWPFLYMAAVALDVESKALRAVAVLYIIMVGLLLLMADPSGVWWYSALAGSAGLAFGVVFFRRMWKQEPNNSMEPTR